MQSPPASLPMMQNFFIFLPSTPDLKPWVSLHRQRYLQPRVLEEEEMKARAEAFGERASSMFKNNVLDEILINMKDDGQFITGYTLAMLEEDFEMILQEVINVSQNVPTQNALEAVLSQFPQSMQARLTQIFQKHVSAFWEKADSALKDDEEENDVEINLETGEKKRRRRPTKTREPGPKGGQELQGQQVPTTASSPTLSTSSFSALSLSSDSAMNFG